MYLLVRYGFKRIGLFTLNMVSQIWFTSSLFRENRSFLPNVAVHKCARTMHPHLVPPVFLREINDLIEGVLICYSCFSYHPKVLGEFVNSLLIIDA